MESHPGFKERLVFLCSTDCSLLTIPGGGQLLLIPHFLTLPYPISRHEAREEAKRAAPGYHKPHIHEHHYDFLHVPHIEEKPLYP